MTDWKKKEHGRDRPLRCTLQLAASGSLRIRV